MKKILFVVVSLLPLLCLPGCDLVRASLGKPTSSDLQALRLAREVREQAVRDSLAAVEAERAALEAAKAAEEEAAATL